ncbi:MULTISPECIES: CsbD family protein [Nocardiopsidaceae]|uniref:CsbD family protein n=2 Tax=Nocardiopsidaceae TaxID=83676 RepID=A0ABY6YLG0_9ACTN|nr:MULTISPECIES: CsbD family protein [Nocardiopsaceae]MEE2046745.1 CsbD family protein [Nocardiopsis tropica]MEE2049161.1 CsbD family protein [Nocardiopsis umidischolae]WAE73108.1 CsbD family protein [Streptomonospora nanhaiensis]
MSEQNRAGNKADEYKGKAKESLGKATGNEQWQAEGKTEKTTSKLKQAGEKAKDALTSDKKPKAP